MQAQRVRTREIFHSVGVTQGWGPISVLAVGEEERGPHLVPVQLGEHRQIPHKCLLLSPPHPAAPHRDPGL